LGQQQGFFLPFIFPCIFPLKLVSTYSISRLSWWYGGWGSAYQSHGHRFDPWSRKTPHATEQRGPSTTTTEPAHPGVCRPQPLSPHATTRECPCIPRRTSAAKNRLFFFKVYYDISYQKRRMQGKQEVQSILHISKLPSELFGNDSY